MPNDPVNSGSYVYDYAGSAADYILRAILEDNTNPALDSDVDIDQTIGGKFMVCAENFADDGVNEYCLKP